LNRRDAMQRVAFLVGGALSAPTMIAMLEGCKSNTASEAATSFAFSTDYKSLVSEIAEIIIPKTTTPGAKDAGVGPFIEMMLKDCYTPAQQEHFVKGLDALEEESKKVNGGKKFLESTPEQQTALLKSFEAMAKEESKKNEAAKKIIDAETGLAKDTKGKTEAPPTPFFRLMKELTLLGYFTSEVGCKEALTYVQVPGKYEGCVKMTPGQKAWAL
jgi:hypothetical protein